MDELIRRVDVARPLLEKYREAKRQAERAWKLRNLGSYLAFRSDMETLRACIQIAVEAPAMGEAGREILLDALEHYGERAQVDMMLEEMAELSKALLKLRRVKKHEITEPLFLVKNVEEEIADVEIVLNQMKLLFPGWGSGCRQSYRGWRSGSRKRGGRMQTKEELLEIERRLLVEMGRRYGAHLEKAAAARRARSRERARRAREAAIQGIRTVGGDGGGGQAPRALLRPADGRHNGV